MFDKRVKPVRDVTRGIRAVDKSCEELVANAAQLAIDMIAAGQASKLPVSVGQEILEQVGRLMTAGIQARAMSAGTHVALADLAVTHDAPVAWGDDCPPNPNPDDAIEQTRRDTPVKLVVAA